jgi:SAM-dependent methyltransferase
MRFDPDKVRQFEYAGWEKAAPAYLATFADATRPFCEAILDAAAIGPGMRMLDLACGPGLLAIAAAGRGADASGLDFSPAMLALARAASPGTTFCEGDAEAMPIADAAFDAVVSSFGVHHFPRPAAALAEAHRILRPGGRLAFTTWAEPARNVAWRLLFDAIRAHGDIDAAKTPPSGGNLGSADAVGKLVSEAGFAGVSAETVRREWRLASPHDLIAALRRGTVRTATLIDAQPPAALPAIAAAVARAIEPYRAGDGFAVPIAAILARGTKG